MIVVTSRIRIVSGNADDVARLYRDRLRLADGAPSCRGIEILRNLDQPEEFVVYTRWDDRDAYEDYRRSDAFKRSHQRLRQIGSVVKIDHATRMVDTFEVLS